MESFTHESDDSSSCTQSDDDSTNSSNGTNPFLLCPRGNPPHLRGHGRLHDSVEDIRPYKRARGEPSGQLHYHPSALNTSKGLSKMPYAHNVKGEIHPDGVHRSALLSEGRSYTSSALEDLRGFPSEFASAARSPHAGLPYIGATQNFLAHDQWPGLRQQTYVVKPFATCNAPSSALLLPMNSKLDKMPINFGNNAGNFYLGLADPQPGRCRRTDGKKWRCGRAVVPEQKYCERHMHRGRGRSKASKLAKGTTTIDTNEPHGSGRPLNQPLIQLLSQLTVPVQHVNQPLEVGQQPADAVQPLKWIQKAAQTFQPPNTQLPYLAQPLLAEQLSQFPIQSKTLDWSANQSPMQAEPLDLGHANGRPPVLAQAIPMNAVSEFKMSPDRGAVLATTEASRMPSDYLNDVLSIDVQGIKRLLENAPCSRRSSSVSSKPKQLPNLADLLNMAHVGNLNTEPKKPPSLMDVLKMVDSPTSSRVRAGMSSVFNHRHLNTTQASADLCTTICQTGRDLLDSGYSGTSLSLAWPDDRSPEQQSKQYLSNVPGTMNLVTSQTPNGMMNTHTQGECLQPLAARDSYKGPSPNCTEACTSRLGKQTGQTSETTNIRQPELLLEESKDSCGTLVNFEKTRWNLMEERSQSTRKLNKGIITMEDVDYTPADRGFDNPRSLMVLENSPSSKNVTPNHHNASPESDSESLVILEGSLDVCDSSGKSKGRLLGLTERNLNQHIGEESPNINGLVSMKKRVNLCESYANLDMNIPILVAKDERQQGIGELGRASPSSTTPIENVQRKTALDRSSSGSSCNESSLSKSTLSLDPAAVSNPEPSSHSSLANQWEAKVGHEKACCLACYHLLLDEAAISSSLL